MTMNIMLPLIVLMTALSLPLSSQTAKPKFAIEHRKAEPAKGCIISDGVWKKVAVKQTFHAPWSKLDDDTRFQCYLSDNYFYFKFRVNDSTLTLKRPFGKKLDVAREDRVEIFLSATAGMSVYYCLETDPDGHTLDYKAEYCRKFDYGWSFSTLETETSKASDLKSHIVAGRLSTAEMKRLGIDTDKFYMGIFRADFDTPRRVVWYSLLPVYRKKADFHRPEMLFEATSHRK